MTADPQREEALKKANQVRLARAELKRQIAVGDVSAAEVILYAPSEAANWSVCDVLRSQRRWGDTRCLKFLRTNEIPERKPIGKLTDRQRKLIAEQLGSTPKLELVRAG
jgi:hypothetical protein